VRECEAAKMAQGGGWTMRVGEGGGQRRKRRRMGGRKSAKHGKEASKTGKKRTKVNPIPTRLEDMSKCINIMKNVIGRVDKEACCYTIPYSVILSITLFCSYSSHP
jgi:hypothetical protein